MLARKTLLKISSCKLRKDIVQRLSIDTTENVKNIAESRPVEKSLNQVVLLGRVGADPVKKGTEENPVVVFPVATHTAFKDESGELNEKTDWHRVCVFKPRLRQLVFDYLQKGHRVHVQGKISYGTVQEAGNVRHVTNIIADDVIFLTRNTD